MLFAIRCAASEPAGPRVMWAQRSGSGHGKVELVLAGKSGVMMSHLLLFGGSKYDWTQYGCRVEIDVRVSRYLTIGRFSGEKRVAST